MEREVEKVEGGCTKLARKPDAARGPLLVTVAVDIEDGRTGSVDVHERDNPEELAEAFVKQEKLSTALVPVVASMLAEQQLRHRGVGVVPAGVERGSSRSAASVLGGGEAASVASSATLGASEAERAATFEALEQRFAQQKRRGRRRPRGGSAGVHKSGVTHVHNRLGVSGPGGSKDGVLDGEVVESRGPRLPKATVMALSKRLYEEKDARELRRLALLKEQEAAEEQLMQRPERKSKVEVHRPEDNLPAKERSAALAERLYAEGKKRQESRERMEALQEQRRKEAEEKEMQELRSAPELSKKSRKLAQVARDPDVAAARERKRRAIVEAERRKREEEERKECTFRPKISRASKVIVARAHQAAMSQSELDPPAAFDEWFAASKKDELSASRKSNNSTSSPRPTSVSSRLYAEAERRRIAARAARREARRQQRDGDAGDVHKARVMRASTLDRLVGEAKEREERRRRAEEEALKRDPTTGAPRGRPYVPGARQRTGAPAGDVAARLVADGMEREAARRNLEEENIRRRKQSAGKSFVSRKSDQVLQNLRRRAFVGAFVLLARSVHASDAQRAALNRRCRRSVLGTPAEKDLDADEMAFLLDEELARADNDVVAPLYRGLDPYGDSASPKESQDLADRVRQGGHTIDLSKACLDILAPSLRHAIAPALEPKQSSEQPLTLDAFARMAGAAMEHKGGGASVYLEARRKTRSASAISSSSSSSPAHHQKTSSSSSSSSSPTHHQKTSSSSSPRSKKPRSRTSSVPIEQRLLMQGKRYQLRAEAARQAVQAARQRQQSQEEQKVQPFKARPLPSWMRHDVIVPPPIISPSPNPPKTPQQQQQNPPLLDEPFHTPEVSRQDLEKLARATERASKITSKLSLPTSPNHPTNPTPQNASSPTQNQQSEPPQKYESPDGPPAGLVSPSAASSPADDDSSTQSALSPLRTDLTGPRRRIRAEPGQSIARPPPKPASAADLRARIAAASKVSSDKQ